MLRPPILDPGRLAHRISEASIQETCSQFLELDGWRRIRTDLKHLRGMGVQEPGMADDFFFRPKFTPQANANAGQFWVQAQAEIFWVEWKRERGGNGKRALFTKAEKAMIHQKAWHAQERARGALTVILGEDCPATIEGFQDWYRKSGLRRRL